jgi:hypothetical protein
MWCDRERKSGPRGAFERAVLELGNDFATADDAIGNRRANGAREERPFSERGIPDLRADLPPAIRIPASPGADEAPPLAVRQKTNSLGDLGRRGLVRLFCELRCNSFGERVDARSLWSDEREEQCEVVDLSERVELAPAVATLRATQPMAAPKRPARAADAGLLVHVTEARSRRSPTLDALRDMSGAGIRLACAVGSLVLTTRGSSKLKNQVRSSTRFLSFSETTSVPR